MTNSVITTILKKPDFFDLNMSLGFRRFIILPSRVRNNLMLAHYLETKSTDCHNRIVSFFQAMTIEEYHTYLKSA